MTYEGLTIQSFWVGDECSDDLLYGMTRADWDAWISRTRTRPAKVELAPITPDNADAVGEIETHKSQERFVAPMAINFQDALVLSTTEGGSTPWFRAIEADGEVVGFMLASAINQHRTTPYLVRLLIDRMHQRRGIGSAALDLFEQWCLDEGATSVEVAWCEGPGSPARVYVGRGYEPTGEIRGGEIFAVKQLS